MIYLQLQISLIICVSAINGMDDGLRASIGEFKYIVSIWKRNKPLCAGAIIHKRFILTAAHCACTETADLFVYAGLIDLEDPNLIERNVKAIHAYYGTEGIRRENPERLVYKNDILILETDIAFFWSSTVAPIAIAEAEQWNPCEPCLVPGWHLSVKDGITTMYSLSAYAHVLNDKTCHRLISTLFTNEMCAYDDFGKSIAVQGDSGSPVVCRGVASGMIVRGYAKRDKPTIILSIYPYREFIYQTIHDDTADAYPYEFPYVASIWSYTSANYICGGIIFDDLHVITMAHCVKDLKRADIRVLTGKHMLSEQSLWPDWSSVDRVDLYVHRERDYSGYSQNCITVLKLKKSLHWSPFVKGAFLSIEKDLLPGQQCQVLQWSRKNQWWGGITRKLVWVPAVILSNQRCEELGLFIGSNEFCATSKYEYPLAFEEDRGNPIVCEGIVVGILAYIPPMSSLFAPSQAIFIRLFSYVDNIQFANQRN